MYVVVDIEADGPIPGDYSMIQIGAVLVSDKIEQTFVSNLAPISDNYVKEALAVSGLTRADTLTFLPAQHVMASFDVWLTELGKDDRLIMVADNAGFDWSFVNWYFHHFLGRNPLGWSCLSLTSLAKGYERDMKKGFKHRRNTKHSHNALDDAMGNAEALLSYRGQIKNL